MTAPIDQLSEGIEIPNYVWVGFSKDDGEPKSVQPVKPHGDIGGDLDWQLYFPADLYRKESQ